MHRACVNGAVGNGGQTTISRFHSVRAKSWSVPDYSRFQLRSLGPPRPPTPCPPVQRALDFLLEPRLSKCNVAVRRLPDRSYCLSIQVGLEKSSIRFPARFFIVSQPHVFVVRRNQPVDSTKRIGRVARPSIGAGLTDHAGPNRIELDIAIAGQHVIFTLCQA